ncbi:EamA-like transporter family protein, partial [Cronobacter sakazakii]|nr:EamA-like transporter family protein [Cronobacter sakazakii]
MFLRIIMQLLLIALVIAGGMGLS